MRSFGESCRGCLHFIVLSGFDVSCLSMSMLAGVSERLFCLVLRFVLSCRVLSRPVAPLASLAPPRGSERLFCLVLRFVLSCRVSSRPVAPLASLAPPRGSAVCTTTHYNSLLLATIHYFSLLLTTTLYYSLLFTTT